MLKKIRIDLIFKGIPKEQEPNNNLKYLEFYANKKELE